MNYKNALTFAMNILAHDPRVKFLGYNVTHGSRAYGTLDGVSLDKCIETPLAENLMMDLAIGMSLEGYTPVVFFERHDFLLNGLDAIVNHLDKIKQMSGGKFNTPVIVRAVVGSKKPIYPGPQHTQDFTKMLKEVVSFPVKELKTADEIITAYELALASQEPHILVEWKEKYGEGT